MTRVSRSSSNTVVPSPDIFQPPASGSVPASSPSVTDHLEVAAASPAPKFEIAHLKHAFPANLDVTGTLSDRLTRFAARWPKHVRIVPNIGFAFSEGGVTKQRSLVVISPGNEYTSPLGERKALRADYLRAVSAGSISFPMQNAPYHLYARVGSNCYDLNASEFREREQEMRTPILEPLVELSPKEMARVAEYFELARDDKRAVFGSFTVAGGPTEVTGTLADNRPKDGLHNCTSWITMAPIGADGEQLRDLVKAPRGMIIYDNPGWWGKYLLAGSTSPRCEHAVLWVKESIDEVAAALTPGSTMSWNYNEK